jgi:hypothetical protein
MANTCTRCGLPAARFVEMGEIGNGGGPWPLRTESLCHECYEDLLRWLAVRLPTHCGNRMTYAEIYAGGETHGYWRCPGCGERRTCHG